MWKNVCSKTIMTEIFLQIIDHKQMLKSPNFRSSWLHEMFDAFIDHQKVVLRIKKYYSTMQHHQSKIISNLRIKEKV